VKNPMGRSGEHSAKKFERSSLTLVRDVLRYVDAGNYPAKIARFLGKPRSHIHYYLRSLQHAGYIRKETKQAKGKPVFYMLTENAKKLLDRLENSAVPSRTLRLHNFVVKYPVLEGPRVTVDWRRVELQNWDQFVGSACGLSCRKNTDSLEVFADVIEGPDPSELVYRAGRECDCVARYLESKFQMRLGLGSPSRKPHFSVYDPFAEKFTENMEFTDPSLAKMDRSPPSPGEIDFFSPDAARSYLVMMATGPARLSQIERQLETLVKGQATFDQRMAKIETAIILTASILKNVPDQIRSGIVEGLKQAFRKPEPCWSLEKFIAVKERIA